MKIGIISNLYPPLIRGGAELVAAMMAEGLKEAWQHVFVISTKPAQGFKSWQISEGEVNDIPVKRIYPANIYYYLNDYKFPLPIRFIWRLFDIFNIFSYWQTRRILLQEKPEVVITHNLTGFGFLIPLLLRQLKIKHVHILHDVQLVIPSGLIIKEQENNWESRLVKLTGYDKLTKKLFASPQLIISPSRYLLNFYQEKGFFPQSQKVVLPNPVRSAINLHKKPTAELNLLYLGQVHKAKGVLELITNFRKLSLPQARLHVAGVGQDLAKAKELADDDQRIIFYGWLSQQQLLPLLAKMDLAVVPSLCYENSPTVIYEVLNLGIPVLAADIGGTAELIKEGKNGWIFPAANWELMNKKIIGLYQQREKLSLLSANCQHSVSSYLLPNYIGKLLEYINADQ